MQKYLSTIARLWKLLKPFHKDFYLQLIFTVCIQALLVSQVAFAAKVLDLVIKKDFEQAVFYTFYILGLNIARIIINYISDVHAQNKLDYAIQQYLQHYSFEKIFKLNISQYIEDHSAIKEQVINRGEHAVEIIISTLILNALPTLTQITFAIGAIAFYSVPVALWTLIVLIAVSIWTIWFSNYHRPFIKNDMDNWDKHKRIRTESFQHLPLIRILSAQDVYLKRYLEKRQELLNYKKFVWTKNIKHGWRRVAISNISKTISSLAIVYSAYLGTITVGSIYALWTYISEANSQITNIIQTMKQVPLRFVELEKYLAIIDKEALFDESGSQADLDKDITFKNLVFSYPQGNAPLFDGLSLTIPAGKTTAFVGTSGSGKTTIAKLLLRLYNYSSGGIYIGDKELSSIDANFLRYHTGYVEQHVDLLDQSLRENITLSLKKREHITEETLESVARQSRIDQFYHRLGETKFETILGERGVKLSGGERQRVGIARAIIKNPDILIFDEATSALDAENEKYVMEAINTVSKGKTTIIIAHRLSTVRNADKIIMMEKGRVVAEGTHDELMEKSPEYKNLVEHQV